MADALAASIDALYQVLAWPTAGFVLLGTLIGFLVGLLPGLGGPAALALLLPLTFALDPLDALALLTAAAAVTVTAGDMTSILLGVPGEVTSAALLPDGHALARRGEGGRAAGAALASAFIGAGLGALALVAAVPVARPLLSAIASPELALLALLGICLVIPLSAGAPVKGLVSGALGLLLATVGLDPATAAPRFTLGQLFLWDGVGLLPTALGLFAVPEAIALASGSVVAAPGAAAASGAFQGIREALARWRLVLRCGLIGAGVGVLPAAGASVSQWVAYAHAAQSSARRPFFGSGEIDGVIGPAAAGSATFGGALVPTLALGIPGSLATAFLLAALVLKGIAPGPALLAPEAEGGRLTLLFALVWFIVLANSAASLAAVGLLDKLAAVSRLRPTLLAPIVLTMVLVGAFAERNVPGDLGVLIAAGTLGWVMVRFGWPRAPMLLGLVLGALFERRVFLAASAYGWTSIARPGAIVLLGVLAYVLVRLLRQPFRWPLGAAEPTGARGDVLFCGALTVLLVAAASESVGLPARAAALPRVLIAVSLGLVLLQSLTSFRTLRADRESAARAPAADDRSRAGFGWLLVFASGAGIFGFTAGTWLSCVVYTRAAHRESWGTSLALAGGLAVLAYLLLNRVLSAPRFGLLPSLLAGLGY